MNFKSASSSDLPRAEDLMSEMKKYKSIDEVVILPSGKKTTPREIFMPTVVSYVHNYEEYELCEQLHMKEKNIDTTEARIRLNHMKMLLAQPILDAANCACVTLSLSGFNFAYIYVIFTDPISIAYISLGDSMKSYDGEWRNMITNFAGYVYIANNYQDELDKLSELFSSAQPPKINIYYSTQLKDNAINAIMDIIKDENLDRNLLVLARFIGNFDDPTRDVSSAMSKFCNKSNRARLPTGQSYSEIYRILGSFMDTRESQSDVPVFSRSVRAGQKLMQLTPDETSHPINSSYQAWNEINVTCVAMDLLLNMISPSFAIHSFWLMIYETSKFMYNVDTMRTKIVESQTIQMTPEDKRTNKILSTQAVCMANEYCGPTFRFSLKSARLRERTLKYGSKYVFELIYALFCLHSRIGQFHGDFHCDNATIMDLICAQNERTDADAKWKICYVINDAKYCFSHDGSYGCVIDFSRSIQLDNPSWIERVIEKYELYFGEPKPKNKDKFDQVVYSALDYPHILENLKKIASGFDIYEFAHTVNMQCKNEIKDSAFGKLIEDIEIFARDALLNYITEQKQDDAREWLALTILKKYWPGAVISDFSTSDVYRGVYWYNNPMKYSAKEYADLPRSIARSSGMRDASDTPVDFYLYPAVVVKLRYDLYNLFLQGLMGKDTNA